MKICQIFAGTGEGGLEKHVYELSLSLKNKSLNITVIAHPKFKKLFKNINFIPLNLSKNRFNILLLYKLYKIIKQNRFDIVHTHANKATDMVIKLKPFLNSKIVSTLHSYKKNISSFEKSDFVITVSKKISKNLKNKKQKTIYNGIKFENIKTDKSILEKYKIPKDKFLICSAGRLCDVKRFDILIKSLKNLDVFCILIGSGEKELELQTLAKKEKVEQKILFTGNIDNNDVKQLMKTSNLFIITSDKEGFPYVFIESLLSETPIISTDVSDIKEIISEKNIIEFDNPIMLSTKISEIKINYKKFVFDFEIIFNFAKKTFTLDYMVDETIIVYKGLLT